MANNLRNMTESEFLNEIDMIVQADPGSTAISDQLSSLKGWDIKVLSSCETVGDLARLCEVEIV